MEVRAPNVTKCRCCPRHFNSPADLCQVDGCGMCRSCHVTAYGVTQPHPYNGDDFLSPEKRELIARKK